MRINDAKLWTHDRDQYILKNRKWQIFKIMYFVKFIMIFIDRDFCFLFLSKIFCNSILSHQNWWNPDNDLTYSMKYEAYRAIFG